MPGKRKKRKFANSSNENGKLVKCIKKPHLLFFYFLTDTVPDTRETLTWQIFSLFLIGNIKSI